MAILHAAKILPKPPVAQVSQLDTSSITAEGIVDELYGVPRWLFDNSPVGRAMQSDRLPNIYESVGIDGVSAPEAGESGFKDSEGIYYETPNLSAADFLPYPGFSQAEPLRGVPAFPEDRGIEDLAYGNPFPTDVDNSGIMQIIKGKGGDWIDVQEEHSGGSSKGRFVDDTVNEALEEAKLPSIFGDISYDEIIEEANYYLDDPDASSNDIAGASEELRKAHWNQWVDKKLKKYIKNDMATMGDPVRAKIKETGRTILQGDEHLNWDSYLAEGVEESGTPASSWELAADSSVSQKPIHEIITESERLGADIPEWVYKKDDGSPAYSATSSVLSNLNIDHVRDEIFNAMETDSELPNDLQIRPGKLPKMNVADVFDHVARIDEWRVKNQRNAPITQTMSADMVKDYPAEGYRWIELNRAGQFRAESDSMSHSVRGFEPEGSKGHNPTYGQLRGGFRDIEEGRTKVYSLRDTDTGESLATVETTIEVPREIHDEIEYEVLLESRKQGWDYGEADHQKNKRYKNWKANNPDKVITKIHQIKGYDPDLPIDKRSNGPVVETGIEMVQDLIINQLHNAEFDKGYNPSAGTGDHRNARMILLNQSQSSIRESVDHILYDFFGSKRMTAREYERILDAVTKDLLYIDAKHITNEEVVQMATKYSGD